MGVLLPLNWPSYLGLTAAKDSGKVLIIIIYCYLIIIISSIIIIKQLFASGSWIFTNIHEPEANNRFSIITQVIIEIPKQRNVKFYHNLPLFIGVHTTLLASMCHAMPFSARALKKHLTFIPCGKKQIEMWFIVVCTLIDNKYASVLFSQTFFFLIASALSEFAKLFLQRKSDAYK